MTTFVATSFEKNLRIFEAEYDRLHNRVPRGPTAQS